MSVLLWFCVVCALTPFSLGSGKSVYMSLVERHFRRRELSRVDKLITVIDRQLLVE